MAPFLCAGDETVSRLIAFIFLFVTGQRNKLCIRAHACRNKPTWLRLHIHVSQCRFIASWHNVRTINVSYVARLSHYRDSLTFCSFKSKMYTAQANKAFWVCGCPLWRDGGLCSFRLTAKTRPCDRGAPTCKRRGGEEKVKDLRVAFICISWPLFFFLIFQAVKLMDYLSASQSSFYPLFVFLDWASSCLLLRPPEHTGQARVLTFDLCWWEFHYFSHRNKGDETPNRNYMWLWNSTCFFFFFFFWYFWINELILLHQRNYPIDPGTI